MTEEERRNHTYIGDRVYAEFVGHGVWLKTGDHRDYLCDNKIFLDPSVLDDLNRFYNHKMMQLQCEHDFHEYEYNNKRVNTCQKCGYMKISELESNDRRPIY